MSRVLSCPFPANLNPIGQNTFKFEITKIKGVTYFLQQVELPTVSLGETTQVSNFADIALPGDRMTFDTLTISFMIDSDFANYKSIFNWIEGQGFPGGHSQSLGISEAFSDATLQVLDQLGNTATTIQFIDLVPTSLSGLQFESNVDDVQYLVGRATFRYTLYKFL